MGICKRFDENDIHDVVTAPDATGPAPSGNAVLIPPGHWKYGYGKFDFSDQGLYELFDPFAAGNYFIVSGDDPYLLMNSLCRLHQFGSQDNGMTVSQLLNTMTWRPIVTQCGPTTTLARSLLGTLGWSTRTCRLLTADTPNGYDDGHVTCEFYYDGKWRHIDPSLHRWWLKEDGVASFKDYFGESLFPHITYPVTKAFYPYAAGTGSGFHTSIWLDITDQQQWTNRIFQIPGIDHTDGKTYFYLPSGTESRATWVLGLQSTYRIISKSAWETMFYS